MGADWAMGRAGAGRFFRLPVEAPRRGGARACAGRSRSRCRTGCGAVSAGGGGGTMQPAEPGVRPADVPAECCAAAVRMPPSAEL